MPEIGSPITSEQTVAPKPLEQGVQEVRQALGGKAEQLLPEGKQVVGITREDFNKGFAGTELAQSPEGSGPDGHLYGISFGDGSETYVLQHKTTGGNPFANLSPLGGADLRHWETYTYEWDGQETIKTTEPSGKVTEVKGQQWGKPEAMLPTLRESLGHARGTETFARTPQPNSPQA